MPADGPGDGGRLRRRIVTPHHHRTDGGIRGGFTLLNVAISVLGVAFLLAYIHPFGVRWTPDAASYFAAAESVMAGDGFRDFYARPLKTFPPLFPLVLGVASGGILDPRDVAGPLNVVLVGLIAFVVGQYLRDQLESRFLALWGCFMAALANAHLLRIYLALAEPLFILLSVLALISADRFLASNRTRTLLWAAAFTASACLTRYIGVSVLAYLVLVLLLHPQAASSAAQRAGRIALFLLIATGPVALWFLRNHLVIGSLHPSPPPDGDPALMLLDIWDTQSRWIDGTHVWAYLILLVLAVALWKRIAAADWRPAWLFGGYSLSYAASLLTILLFVVTIADNPGDIRFWAPLYVPVMIVGLCVLDRVFVAERKHPLLGSVGQLPILRRVMPGFRGSVLTALVVILLSLDAADTVRTNTDTLVQAFRGELPLSRNTARFTGSETLRYVRETPGVVGTIFTNKPYAVFLHARKDGLRTRFYPQLRSKLAAQLAQAPDPAFLVLLHEGYAKGSGDSDDGPDLRTFPGLEPIAEFEDGMVFRVVKTE